MFKNQPKTPIKPSKTDLLVMRLGWLIVALNFILVAVFFLNLPETIPTHFNIKGIADGYGNKNDIWMLPLLNLITYLGLTLLITKVKPHHYNYPIKVTEENAPIVYGLSLKMLVWLNFGIAILFTLLSLHTLLLAKEITTIDLGWLLLVFITSITFGPLFFIYKMFSLSKA